MGTKYPGNSISGYNSSPPSDDGTVVDSNKVKYSTPKTKLTDPIKTFVEAIETDLVEALDRGPVASSATLTLGASNYNDIIEATGSGDIILSDAATLTAGWFCDIKNVGASSRALTRATATDLIDGVTADTSVPSGKELRIFVDAAAAGFRTMFSNSDTLDSSHYPENLALSASVSSNVLTVTLTGKDLAAPSSSNKVKVPFVSETLTTGDYDVISATAATALTVDAGATLGFTSSEDGYIYIYALNNSGTIELACRKKALRDLSGRVTTTVLDTSADSDNVMYSDTARTNLPYRLIGVLRITTASTAGNWDSSPTEVRPWTPGMPITGDAVDVVYTQDGEVATGTTAMPDDNTIPQITEGDEYMTVAITPKSTINNLKIDIVGNLSNPLEAKITGALFQDSTAGALAGAQDTTDGTTPESLHQLTFTHWMAAGTVSATTFRFRAGAASGTTSFNGTSGARKLGGVCASSMTVTEYQA